MIKKILVLVAIGLFTINATAQDGKKAAKKESGCVVKDINDC